VLLLALSTGHKVGLAVVAGAFILFALGVSFLLPRYRPSFPGRGLPAFIIVSLLFFFGMLTAVEVFGAESEEGEQAESPQAGGGEAAGKRTIVVTGTEYRFKLSPEKLGPGAYVFKLENAGKQPHNLTITGPQVSNEATPTIPGGKSASIDVTLARGTYELYCSVPGHKELGMDAKLTVSGSA
jgi:plastocyanin